MQNIHSKKFFFHSPLLPIIIITKIAKTNNSILEIQSRILNYDYFYHSYNMEYNIPFSAN